MNTIALSARLPAGKVGELTQLRSGAVQWRPDAGWEASGQQPRLGLEFLRTPGLRSTSGELPTWFENLLPEQGTPLRARLCRAKHLRDGQSFALLAAVGDDLPGAVEVARTSMTNAEAASPPTCDEVPPNAASATSSADRSDGRLHLSALAGNQLKFSMSMIHDRFALGARAGREQWIVKFPGSDYPELPEVEATTMSWAMAAGFEVPPHMVLSAEKLEGIPPGWLEPSDSIGLVFAIRRFDRRTDGSKIHHEDLCQALAIRPANKYGDDSPGVAFDGALRLVIDVCGEEQGREMARRAGFMIASGNGDAHLKNWALLWGERTRPVLAPCYDLVSTISWPRLGWTDRAVPKLALKLGGTRRFSELDEARLESCAKGAKHAWVEAEILEGIDRAWSAWRSKAFAVPDRMHQAIVEHWRRVPILRKVAGT